MTGSSLPASDDTAWRARSRAGGFALALACLGLCGCQPACPRGQALLPEAQLFFGGSVPDDAWAGFAASTLTSAFPDGFTVFDATGQWRDPASGRTVHEHTRVVQVFGPAVQAQVAPVSAAYRLRFHQISVGVVTGAACAAF